MPSDVVSEKYVDFEDSRQEVWCWDSEGKFRRHKLKNVIAGDTDSCILKLPPKIEEKSLDVIVETCDEMIQRVDADFPSFLRMAFNCPESRLRSVRTDREIVSDRSLFVTKKRYAMNVVDSEGKRVNFTKIMGLEVKKSDTSRSVKAFLRMMIDLILDGHSRGDLIKKKQEYKELFFTQDIKELGVPMPATMLKVYMDRYKESGSTKGFPYHIRAAMFYNSLCGPMDREIYVGEKFYVCNVRHMDSKYIACPMDLNDVPDIVTSIPIDYEAMWTKAERKINNYMKSLGWDLQGMRDQKAKEWFGV